MVYGLSTSREITGDTNVPEWFQRPWWGSEFQLAEMVFLARHKEIKPGKRWAMLGHSPAFRGGALQSEVWMGLMSSLVHVWVITTSQSSLLGWQAGCFSQWKTLGGFCLLRWLERLEVLTLPKCSWRIYFFNGIFTVPWTHLNRNWKSGSLLVHPECNLNP